MFSHIVSAQYSNELTELKSDVRYSVWSSNSWLDVSHCTKMYPKALMSWSPLSASNLAMFPHVLESSWLPPVPNPILELQEWQSPSSLARIPILALERVVMVHSALNPSLLQVSCKEASGPTTDFHLSRPSEVLRYCPSAISEYRELALLVISIKLIWLLIFIPRQILEKDVFQ